MTVVAFRKPALAIGCSSCGATVDAACDCGAPYIPAGQRAAAAVAANPQMSDRAIAQEIGVDHKTVGNVRRAGGEHSPPEKRIGLDGKSYPATRRVEITEDSPSELRKAFLFYAYEARLLARYEGPVDHEVIESASQTAAAWQQLVNAMKGISNG